MLSAAAVVPASPVLVPTVATGPSDVDRDLRARCREAVSALVATRPDLLLVVGDAPATGSRPGGWDWSALGVEASSGRGAALPLALAVGDWLLDAAGWTGPRDRVGVAAETTRQDCAALGRRLAGAAPRVALLVCGDGSACRTEKAPGYYHPDAEPFDAAAEAALSAADVDALARLDPARARALLCTGRASWQVLAGAARDARWDPALLWAGAPYGVGYLVALWRPAG